MGLSLQSSKNPGDGVADTSVEGCIGSMTFLCGFSCDYKFINAKWLVLASSFCKTTWKNHREIFSSD